MTFDYSKLFDKMHALGMNRSDLTQKAGISTNQMANLGKGKTVQLETAYKVCRVLNMSLDEIMPLDENVQ